MDFKSMSDHELLLIINLKSETKYTHDQLQEARQVYIERMYSGPSSAMKASSARKTENIPPVAEEQSKPVQEEKTAPVQKVSSPPTAFDFIDITEKQAVPEETIVFPVIRESEEKAAEDKITETEQHVTEELLEDIPVTKPEENIASSEPYEGVSEPAEKKNPPASYTYIPLDHDSYRPSFSSESIVPDGKKNSVRTLLHGILVYLLIPVMMIKELCVFASCMVLLVSDFKSVLYHLCTLTDFAYMIFILVIWYFALNKRASAACRILVFAEIFRAISELLMMQSFFGGVLTMIYIILLLLTSFSIRKSR